MEKNRVCPVWVGYLLACPIRKLTQNPKKILSPYLEKGMKVLDVGSAMGFFSIPAAKLVGNNGKVVCVDLQEKMLVKLNKRAKKAKVDSIIKTHKCSTDSLLLEEYNSSIDLVILFAVAHELSNQEKAFKEIFASLKPGGKLLFAEPKGGHVTDEEFKHEIDLAKKAGFKVMDNVNISSSRTVILKK